jgi:hypothetical protein
VNRSKVECERLERVFYGLDLKAMNAMVGKLNHGTSRRRVEFPRATPGAAIDLGPRRYESKCLDELRDAVVAAYGTAAGAAAAMEKIQTHECIDRLVFWEKLKTPSAATADAEAPDDHIHRTRLEPGMFWRIVRHSTAKIRERGKLCG